ncbi:hypothetical protein H5T56_03700 [Candidatus Bipolaricaulota bacterium]|nr:hypothetical protein [Candidatus Bipolaricaulota bacterium]
MENTWKEFYQVALDRFFSGTYKGPYEEEKIRAFEKALPDRLPWEVEG